MERSGLPRNAMSFYQPTIYYGMGVTYATYLCRCRHCQMSNLCVWLHNSSLNVCVCVCVCVCYVHTL